MRHLALVAATAVTIALLSVLLPQAPASAAPFPRGLPAAVHEDSCAPGVKRCVWDARHRGNRTGRSYMLVRAHGDFRVKRLTHRRAHRLVARWCQRPTVNCRY